MGFSPSLVSSVAPKSASKAMIVGGVLEMLEDAERRESVWEDLRNFQMKLLVGGE